MMWWKGTIAAIKKRRKENGKKEKKNMTREIEFFGGASAQLEESCAVSC